MTKVKKILGVVAAAAMAISMCVASASAAAKTITVTVKNVPATLTNPNLYVWGNNAAGDKQEPKAWPGAKLTKDGDVYTATVSIDTAKISLIVNGTMTGKGLVQTSDIKDISTATGKIEIDMTGGLKTEKNGANGKMEDHLSASAKAIGDAATTTAPAKTTTKAPAKTTTKAPAKTVKTTNAKTGNTAAPVAVASVTALACVAVIASKKRK